VAHPKLIDAKNRLLSGIHDSAFNSLILVFGPTGVGKTTLRLKVDQLLAQDALPSLASDPVRLPVFSLEAVAPVSGVFNWREHFRRLLFQVQEPLVDYKMKPEYSTLLKPAKCFRPGHQPTTAEYQYAVEQALYHRRPSAVIIDEAQHLGKVPSGRRLADQLDVIKSVASHARTIHVLVGTYDLLAFRNLSGQLSRRSLDIHFPRYDASNTEQRTVFQRALYSFARHFPLAEPPDLVQHWEYLYERSLGCVGVLKDWLARALAVLAREEKGSLTLPVLQSTALSIAQCDKMLAEALEGEGQMTEREGHILSLRSRLGLTSVVRNNQTSVKTPVPRERPQPVSSMGAIRKSIHYRPGQRQPTRDRVGNEVGNASV